MPKKKPATTTKKPNRMEAAKERASAAVLKRRAQLEARRREKERDEAAAALALQLPVEAVRAVAEVEAAERMRQFEGRQQLIPGVEPVADTGLVVFRPRSDDEQLTVMTVRTTRADIRLYREAARLAGDVFPMTWARRELRLIAKARIVEASR